MNFSTCRTFFGKQQMSLIKVYSAFGGKIVLKTETVNKSEMVIITSNVIDTLYGGEFGVCVSMYLVCFVHIRRI